MVIAYDLAKEPITCFLVKLKKRFTDKAIKNGIKVIWECPLPVRVYQKMKKEYQLGFDFYFTLKPHWTDRTVQSGALVLGEWYNHPKKTLTMTCEDLKFEIVGIGICLKIKGRRTLIRKGQYKLDLKWEGK